MVLLCYNNINMANIEAGSVSPEQWRDKVDNHKRYTKTVGDIVKDAHPMHRGIADFARDIRVEREMELDYLLWERLVATFGSNAQRVLEVLYSDYESEQERQIALEAIRPSLTMSPWSSHLHDGFFSTDPAVQEASGERFRHAMEYYNPSQGRLLPFEQEKSIAESLRKSGK